MGQDRTLCSSVWHQHRGLVLENASKDVQLGAQTGPIQGPFWSGLLRETGSLRVSLQRLLGAAGTQVQILCPLKVIHPGHPWGKRTQFTNMRSVGDAGAGAACTRLGAARL